MEAERSRSTGTVGGEAPPRHGRWKRILIFGGLALVLGAALYLVGLVQGRGAVSDLETELTTAEQRLAEAETTSRARAALALVYRSALALEARNFGTANERLSEAASVLSGLPAPDGELTSLQREIQETNLEVAADLESQRTRVLSFADRMLEARPDLLSAPAQDPASDPASDPALAPAPAATPEP